MRRFVLFAAQATDFQEIVCLLGAESGEGTQKLNDIIRFPFSADAGNKNYPVSFQKVIIPLVTLITNKQFKGPLRPLLSRTGNAANPYVYRIRPKQACHRRDASGQKRVRHVPSHE